MNKTQTLRQIEQRLLARRDALRAALAGDASLLRSLGEMTGGDEVDQAIASQEAELQSQMAEVESRELVQIDRAIEKIRAGAYGRCETCERPIAPLRLKYLPYAADCILCARREERRGDAALSHRPVNRVKAFLTEGEEAPAEEAELEVG